MHEKWDGKTDRRKNRPVEFDNILSKMDSIYACLTREFGDKDLAGNKIEGNVTKQLRELNEKVAIQNGRVKTLENRNIFLDGSAKIISILFVAGTAITTLFFAWINGHKH